VPPGAVVVGVDGSEDAGRAVSWAAAQAELERRTLAIVHSTDQVALRDTAWLDVQGIDHIDLVNALRSAAQATLAASAARAAAVAPGIEVVTAVVEDDARIALAGLSAEAHLLVLGSRGHGPLRSALLGSVSASVARHAECPVVVCRRPGGAVPRSTRIIVGADGNPASAPVLEFAFTQASLRHAPLTVMHCFWDVAVASRGAGVVRPGDPGDQVELRQQLAESVAVLAAKFPDVEVTEELARGLVDECLVDLTPAAGLLVVGRSVSHGCARFLHVSSALAVLERARTTVAVVPESACIAT